MDETTRLILFCVASPLIIAAVFVVPRIGQDHDRTRDRGAWRYAVGIAAAVAVAFVALHGWPDEQWHRVAFVPVAGGLLGALLALTPRRAIGWIACGLAAAGTTTVIIWPVIGSESWAIKLLPGAATLVLLLLLEPLAVRRPDVSLPLVLCVVSAASAAVVLWSGFLSLAAPYGALAVGLGVVAIISLFRRRLSLADGPLLVIVPLLCATPVVAWLYYQETTDQPHALAVFLIPSGAAALAWIGEMKPIRSGPPWIAVSLRVLVALIPCAVVSWLLLSGNATSPTPDPMEEMYRQLEGG